MTTPILIVPGLSSSGPAHWQTWFETELPHAVRVVQPDWKRPHLPEWSRHIRRAILRGREPVLIAAHSFGALAALQAADDLSPHVAGLLLVAPADPDKFGVSDVLPTGRLDVPATLVASTNDPWLTFDRAAALAHVWGARLVNLGAAGHINAESGFGPWPLGIRLLEQLKGESALTLFNQASSEVLIRGAAPAFRAAVGEHFATRRRRERTGLAQTPSIAERVRARVATSDAS